jgi:serine/threonine protein kinase
MDSSQFTDCQSQFESLEPLGTQGATCDTFRVKLYGKLHFLKRLKPEFASDIRYQEAFRKEFETGYRLEHPNLVRYVSLTDDGILMEYIDGETLTQHLANRPDYFKNKKNKDKFLRQLLDVVSYLHSHQVLHLDLKPDNILLTRINNDVKLIDLGCCYTDTFTDTQGRTNRFAAPEQFAGEKPDVRTDIYAIGKILELLPNHYIYNKVIARCTAPTPSDRYQSIEEILYDINHQKRNYRYMAAFIAAIVALIICITLLPHQQEVAPVIQILPNDSIAQMQRDVITLSKGEEMDSSRDFVHQNHESLITPKDMQTQFMEEMTLLIDKAYRSTIFTFCDSVFPSPIPSTGKAWADSSTEFHNQIVQIGNELTKKYPNISESTIREEAESRFQSLVSYVFNKMRKNAEKRN